MELRDGGGGVVHTFPPGRVNKCMQRNPGAKVGEEADGLAVERNPIASNEIHYP